MPIPETSGVDWPALRDRLPETSHDVLEELEAGSEEEPEESVEGIRRRLDEMIAGLNRRFEEVKEASSNE